VAVSVGVERPGPDARWVALPLVGLAPALGAVAVVSPAVALASVAGLLFTALAFYDLAAGVALFAAFVFFEQVPGIGGTSVGAVKAGGLILVLAALRRSGTPFLLKEHPLLAYAAAVLAAWALASSLWAVDVSRAAGDGFRLMLGLALVFIVFAAVRQPRHARWLVWGYLGGAAAAAASGIVSPSANEPDRLAGSIGDPNFLAAMLVPAIVFAVFALGWTREPAKRWLLGGGIVLFTLALYLTQSRGGLVALAAAIAAAALFGGPLRRYVIPIAAVVASVGLVYYAAFASSYAVERLTNPGGGTGRADLWSVATEVIEDHPLVGVGAGNFPVVAPQYATEPVNLPSVHLVVDTPKVAHNTYLGVFADLGIVGLFAFAVVLFAGLALTIRATTTFARTGHRELELLSRAVLVSLVGLLTAFVFLSGQYEKQLWLLLGLGIALHALARRRSRNSAYS
jgi:O-antigen ligase